MAVLSATGLGKSMEWKVDYSVGIDEIDQHHQVFFEYFRQLDKAIKSGCKWSDQFYLIQELREYARFHFATEEALMQMHGYTGVESHIATHKGFINTIESFERKSLNSETIREMAEFLRKWFVEHICGEDKRYANSIAARIEKVRNLETC